ncbi:Mitochondrial import receptor subunit tom-22 [Wickerhamomyces ciferrii]|uniref:Mitochondrial import receptor subunit tom-22 n=1 Tax=Wickerhamomyces ciferrii (strain ATCC 14091 / BCRC 22168 / CBS 111 / JCM 3599 / NBRC 0793 / NRRL Y-1031 F-60-10) TaxID=1206466 RepID=K0K818_WICCF|nr:Mitochondrial import receptor subunit tom-22 [Wickerhamomyces ciferrii]CCH40960.1 Mitochondrial import receptor subunit tom-22 [Wickerhamomyces ciferrii]
MVKLTQVEDEQEAIFQQQAASEAKEAASTAYDEESDSDEDDDEFDEDETLYDRIVALKDIIPPHQRTQVSNIFSSAYSTVYSGVSKAGNFTWIFTTSALLLGVPLSLSILAEQQLLELEKEFKLQQGANDILAPGAEQPQQPGVAAPAPAN